MSTTNEERQVEAIAAQNNLTQAVATWQGGIAAERAQERADFEAWKTEIEAWKATQTLTVYTVSGAPDDDGSWERMFSFRHRTPIQVTFSTLGGYFAPGTIVIHIMVDYIGRFFLSVQSKLGAQTMTKVRITTDNTDNGPTFFEGFLPHKGGQPHPVTTQALGPNLPDVQFNGGGINLPPLIHLSEEVTL